MKFLVEFDGVVCSLAETYHAAHREAAEAVGWSALDQVTFWRLMRTKGREAPLLPGAKPQKLKDYQVRFDAIVESDAKVEALSAHKGAKPALTSLSRHGECRFVTLGTNVTGRARILARLGLGGSPAAVEALNADPRTRPAQLAALAKGSTGKPSPRPSLPMYIGREGAVQTGSTSNDRSMVVAAGDALLRSASGAGLVCIGIASGACSEPRLHQAGAAVVFKDLQALVSAVEEKSPDLLRAGWRPAGPIFSR